MKKMMLMMLLFVGITSMASYGQFTKADIESAITQVGGASGFTKIYLNNYHRFYLDGTSDYTLIAYDYSISGFELKETCLYLKSYADNSKSKVTGVRAIPYESIVNIFVLATEMAITLK